MWYIKCRVWIQFCLVISELLPNLTSHTSYMPIYLISVYLLLQLHVSLVIKRANSLLFSIFYRRFRVPEIFFYRFYKHKKSNPYLIEAIFFVAIFNFCKTFNLRVLFFFFLFLGERIRRTAGKATVTSSAVWLRNTVASENACDSDFHGPAWITSFREADVATRLRDMRTWNAVVRETLRRKISSGTPS